MFFKSLLFVAILVVTRQVFGASKNGGWLGNMINSGIDFQDTSLPERPTILLTHEDQTTDCCDTINILPESDLKKCVKANTNTSLTDIELHKVCSLIFNF